MLTVSIEIVSILSASVSPEVSPSVIRKAVGKSDEVNGKATMSRSLQSLFCRFHYVTGVFTFGLWSRAQVC